MMNRRHFLASSSALSAALGLPAPWLEAADTHSSQAGAKPAHCVFIRIGRGANLHEWFPAGFGNDTRFGLVQEPLEPFAKKLTFCSGLWMPGFSPHNISHVLTGVSGPRLSLAPLSVSVDQHIAAARGHETDIPSLVLSATGGQDTISYDVAGNRMYGLSQLDSIYEALFGSPRKVAEIERQTHMLDAINRRLPAVMEPLGNEDRRRLTQYVDSVAHLQRQMAADRKFFLASSKDSDEQGDELDLKIKRTDFSRRTAYIDNLFTLSRLALQSGRTRIVSLNTFAESLHENWKELNTEGWRVREDWHYASHGMSNSEECRKSDLARYISRIDRYWIERLARFLGELDAVEYHDGSLLDYTLVFFTSNMSWGSHNNDNLPALIAGGSALGIKHQGHVGFHGERHKEKAEMRSADPTADQRPEATYPDLLRTISEACGVPAKGLGVSTRVLTELLT